jgi:hypothetical protein
MHSNRRADPAGATEPMFRHYLPALYPHPSAGEPRWGYPLPALGAEREVTIIGPKCTDGEFKLPIKVDEVNPESAAFDRVWDKWTGAGHAQYILSDAFSTNLDPETRDMLFAHDRGRESKFPLGSFERLNEYILQRARGVEDETIVWSGFRSALERIAPGGIVNWQFYMAEHAIHMFRDELRARGLIQTFHSHDPIPHNLHLSPWGQKFLAGLSGLDTVYVHTDRYGRNLEASLRELGLPVPPIKRFDLGIDTAFLDEMLSTVRPDNYERKIPGVTDALTPRQKRFVSDIFASAAIGPDGLPNVAHRFICCDRLVPMKGSPSMFEGIDAFLQERLNRGSDILELRRNFRFYLIENRGGMYERNPGRLEQDLKTDDLSDRFSVHAYLKLQQLEAKYPGIVITADFFSGAARNLLPLLMRGCHTLTGGASEGFNLAVAEAAYVNRDLDTTIVAGNNAGISIRLAEVGLADQAFFPQPGNAASFARSLRSVTDTKEEQSGVLGSRKGKIVDYLSTRADSVLQGGEELLKV